MTSEDPATDSLHADADMAARLRHGDTTAYTTIFRKYYLPILRFLIRYLGSKEAAEDVAQDVFLHLWEGRATLAPHRSLKAYLFTSARNRALNLLAHHDMARQHAEIAIQERGDDVELSTDPHPDETLAAAELWHMAEARIATLSPRLREVYHLNRHEGLAAAEIADVLGTSVHTVYAQLAKVAQALHPVLRAWMKVE